MELRACSILRLALCWLLIAGTAPGHLLAGPPSAPECDERGDSLLHPTPAACLAPIDTDRPHLTDSPHTIAPGAVQVETELLTLATSPSGGLGEGAVLGLGTVLARVGVVRGVDFDIGYQAGTLSRGTGGWSYQAGPTVLVRTKLALFDVGPVATTLAPILLIPTHKSDAVQGGASVLVGAELPAELDLEVNVVATTESDEDGGHRWVFVPTAALTRNLVGPLSAFVESYHELRYSGPHGHTWLANGGLLLRLGRFVQLDAGARCGLTSGATPVTAFLGLSFLAPGAW
jgi:hypothetical protein